MGWPQRRPHRPDLRRCPLLSGLITPCFVPFLFYMYEILVIPLFSRGFLPFIHPFFQVELIELYVK